MYEGAWTFFGSGLADVPQIRDYSDEGTSCCTQFQVTDMHIYIYELGMTAVSEKKNQGREFTNGLIADLIYTVSLYECQQSKDIEQYNLNLNPACY